MVIFCRPLMRVLPKLELRKPLILHNLICSTLSLYAVVVFVIGLIQVCRLQTLWSCLVGQIYHQYGVGEVTKLPIPLLQCGHVHAGRWLLPILLQTFFSFFLETLHKKLAGFYYNKLVLCCYLTRVC